MNLAPIVMGSGGGGFTADQIRQIALMASGVALQGQQVQPGEDAFSSDTRQRFINNTGAPIVLTGTTSAALDAQGLEPDSVAGVEPSSGLAFNDEGDLSLDIGALPSLVTN